MDLTEKKIKAGPKEIFLHIFTIITLYTSIISLNAVAFQLVNFYFEDIVSDYESYFEKDALKWSLAVVTIFFSFYLWANILLQRDIARNPEKKELKIRKWLFYITILISVLVIMGDFVALIWNYLNGELSIRFFLKFLFVFLVAISIFLYYGWNVKKDVLPTQNKEMNIFIKSAVVLAFIVIILGYFSVGTPWSERKARLDEIRISHLQSIQNRIINFWQVKGELPKSLKELEDGLGSYILPKDPQNKTDYEYRKTGELSFELCANFITSNERPQRNIRSSWIHKNGRYCFTRTIDPEIYSPPPRPPVEY